MSRCGGAPRPEPAPPRAGTRLGAAAGPVFVVCPPPPPSSRRATRERAEGELRAQPRAQPRAGRAEAGETPGGCSELHKRGIWQARGGESVFVNAGLLLYIMYFPVYNKEGDYNNFTSAHSWPVLTLGICDALFLYKRPGLGLCFVLLDIFFF